MALEFPNTLEAGAIVAGEQDIPGTLDPFVKNAGFQPFDPSSVPGLDATGGWTKIAEGDYLMKLIAGIDLFESCIVVTMIEDSQAVLQGAMVPPTPFTSPAADESQAMLVTVFDVVNEAPIDVLYNILVYRIAYGGFVTADLPPAPP